jgi:hypothetical protein
MDLEALAIGRGDLFEETGGPLELAVLDGGLRLGDRRRVRLAKIGVGAIDPLGNIEQRATEPYSEVVIVAAVPHGEGRTVAAWLKLVNG